MGRPKGSRNTPRTQAGDPAHQAMHQMPAAPEPVEAPPAPKPDFVTLHLTDEDLEPARRARAAHARAAIRYGRDEIAAELRRKDIGEIEELSVPQVVPF